MSSTSLRFGSRTKSNDNEPYQSNARLITPSSPGPHRQPTLPPWGDDDDDVDDDNEHSGAHSHSSRSNNHSPEMFDPVLPMIESEVSIHMEQPTVDREVLLRQQKHINVASVSVIGGSTSSNTTTSSAATTKRTSGSSAASLTPMTSLSTTSQPIKSTKLVKQKPVVSSALAHPTKPSQAQSGYPAWSSAHSTPQHNPPAAPAPRGNSFHGRGGGGRFAGRDKPPSRNIPAPIGTHPAILSHQAATATPRPTQLITLSVLGPQSSTGSTSASGSSSSGTNTLTTLGSSSSSSTTTTTTTTKGGHVTSSISLYQSQTEELKREQQLNGSSTKPSGSTQKSYSAVASVDTESSRKSSHLTSSTRNSLSAGNSYQDTSRGKSEYGPSSLSSSSSRLTSLSSSTTSGYANQRSTSSLKPTTYSQRVSQTQSQTHRSTSTSVVTTPRAIIRQTSSSSSPQDVAIGQVVVTGVIKSATAVKKLTRKGTIPPTSTPKVSRPVSQQGSGSNVDGISEDTNNPDGKTSGEAQKADQPDETNPEHDSSSTTQHGVTENPFLDPEQPERGSDFHEPAIVPAIVSSYSSEVESGSGSLTAMTAAESQIIPSPSLHSHNSFLPPSVSGTSSSHLHSAPIPPTSGQLYDSYFTSHQFGGIHDPQIPTFDFSSFPDLPANTMYDFSLLSNHSHLPLDIAPGVGSQSSMPIPSMDGTGASAVHPLTSNPTSDGNKYLHPSSLHPSSLHQSSSMNPSTSVGQNNPLMNTADMVSNALDSSLLQRGGGMELGSHLDPHQLGTSSSLSYQQLFQMYNPGTSSFLPAQQLFNPSDKMPGSDNDPLSSISQSHGRDMSSTMQNTSLLVTDSHDPFLPTPYPFHTTMSTHQEQQQQQQRQQQQQPTNHHHHTDMTFSLMGFPSASTSTTILHREEFPDDVFNSLSKKTEDQLSQQTAVKTHHMEPSVVQEQPLPPQQRPHNNQQQQQDLPSTSASAIHVVPTTPDSHANNLSATSAEFHPRHSRQVPGSTKGGNQSQSIHHEHAAEKDHHESNVVKAKVMPAQQVNLGRADAGKGGMSNPDPNHGYATSSDQYQRQPMSTTTQQHGFRSDNQNGYIYDKSSLVNPPNGMHSHPLHPHAPGQVPPQMLSTYPIPNPHSHPPHQHSQYYPAYATGDYDGAEDAPPPPPHLMQYVPRYYPNPQGAGYDGEYDDDGDDDVDDDGEGQYYSQQPYGYQPYAQPHMHPHRHHPMMMAPPQHGDNTAVPHSQMMVPPSQDPPYWYHHPGVPQDYMHNPNLLVSGAAVDYDDEDDDGMNHPMMVPHPQYMPAPMYGYPPHAYGPPVMMPQHQHASQPYHPHARPHQK